ncbi:hypothetical protein PCANC_07099 [Puccinia coronata f. sp. avenae]|uniref:Uncharacterized protein n=1 Tax=Puccinia coronata f. sp. avenae TaxID=200324 RepID=A0A2N5VIQ7_9BASI|nr:hypothetical protein PCANC_07099 [Puccinia coronata f. sp. avenae]
MKLQTISPLVMFTVLATGIMGVVGTLICETCGTQTVVTSTLTSRSMAERVTYTGLDAAAAAPKNGRTSTLQTAEQMLNDY